MYARRALIRALLMGGAAAGLAGCAGVDSEAGSAGSAAAGSATASAASGSAATGAAATEAAVTFTDDLGYEVSVASAERVVACMGSFADAWELAGGTLVGATDDAWENYDIASDAASVGRSTALSLEEILACDPDFVVMTAKSSSKHETGVSQDELKAALDESGIACAFFSVTGFDDYLRMLDVFCQITGRDDLYEENGTDVQARIQEVVATYSVAARDPVPTALVMSASSKGVSAQDADTMTGLMLADLGARNVVEEYDSLLSDFSMEAVLEIDPDYLFVLAAGSDEAAAQQNYEQSVEADPAWSQLTAVHEGRSTVLSQDLFLQKPNNRWDEAYLVLAEALAQ